MIANQIRVLIQRMRLMQLEPEKILMSQPIREALRNEMSGNALYRVTDQAHLFAGLPIVIDASIHHPIVMIKRKQNLSSGEKFLKQLAKNEGIRSTYDNQHAYN